MYKNHDGVLSYTNEEQRILGFVRKKGSVTKEDLLEVVGNSPALVEFWFDWLSSCKEIECIAPTDLHAGRF